MLKQDAKAKDKAVEAEWKHAEKGKKTVSVAGAIPFVQNKVDTSGRFVSPFEHLHFE